MKKIRTIMSIAMLAAMGASAAVFYEEGFEPLPGTATVKASDGKIRFGGNATGQPSISSNEYAVGTIPDGTGVSLVDDGSGTNNVLFVDGRYDKTYGGAVVIDPSAFGGTASVARLSFDLTEYNRKTDGTTCYVDVYAASGYDLSGATDAKIVMDLKNAKNTPTSAFGVNGSAATALLATRTFDHNTALGNLDLSFNYDGSSAIVVVWESQWKSAFKVDNIQISDDGVVAEEGDSSVVMLGGHVSVFDSGAATNNAFVSQIGAGEIVQFNGVNSDGGSFGASGTLVNQGVGASLTNSANGLVLTTTAISSSNAARTNTVSSGGQLGINASAGGANFQQSDATEWSFEYNKDVELKQVIFSGLDADAKDRMRVIANGVTNDLSPADTDETDAWSGAANTEVYTFATPVFVSAGDDIIIATHTNQAVVDPVNNKWGLFGVVVHVPTLFDTHAWIDFGGNPTLYENTTYQSQMGGDDIVAWWGGDIFGRTWDELGTLKNQGIGGSLASLAYNVSITTLNIASSSPTRTNTVVSGGQLGINAVDTAPYNFDADLGSSWTFELNKDVWLGRVGFRYFGASDEALIIIGGVTNTIAVADCEIANYEGNSSFYTFTDPIFIAAGTDVEIQSSSSLWGLGSLLIGVDQPVVVPFTYADWVALYPSMGANTNLTDHADADGYNNLYEFAMGGDPTDANDIGYVPVSSVVEDGGTNYLDYVYHKRKDASLQGLTYYLELTGNLVFPAWTNAGYEVIGNATVGDYRAVTNRIPTTNATQFIELQIEKN
jgi:hypothetical protein